MLEKRVRWICCPFCSAKASEVLFIRYGFFKLLLGLIFFPLQWFAAGQNPDLVKTARESFWRKRECCFSFSLKSYLSSSGLQLSDGSHCWKHFWDLTVNSSESFWVELARWMLAGLIVLVTEGNPKTFCIGQLVSEGGFHLLGYPQALPLLEALSL